MIVLPRYVALFLIWWKFRHVIKMIADIENILNNDDISVVTINIQKKGVEQHRKREYLKGGISKENVQTK